jgi:superfamily II DNA helicase RecQ
MIDDNSVDYFQLVNSNLFKVEYCQMSNDLKKVDLDLLLHEDEKINDNNILAFFISNSFFIFLKKLSSYQL